ncbi:hypothetical protein B0J11DRAFT_290305 [Dendryphion nanum]|uniref:Uncharacterized protein n=1 Tax=Dendryphion nanum TaxID=256645 RepID=A0A9P9ILN3_9PLEO|nr:hypothetical protein B0J11DRAFT_290305 [Dendryphion nanum]
MPVDRTNTNTNGRPLKPTLATTRTAKTPVTPRLAPSLASGSTSQSARTVRSSNAAGSVTPRVNGTSQEDFSTPVKSFLNTNVTPRSSSRKSRVGFGSPNSTPSITPSGTPSSTRPPSAADVPLRDQNHGYNGTGANGLHTAQTSTRSRNGVGGTQYNTTPTPRPPMLHGYNSAASDASGAQFFHASEARAQDPIPPPKKSPVFFYANGTQDETLRSPQAPSPPLSAVGRSQSASKFFHADSVSEGRSGSPILTPPAGPTSPEPWPNMNPSHRHPSLRPPSPSRDSNIHLSYRKGASQVMRPSLASRPSGISILSGHSQASESPNDRSRRRSSAASIIRFGHSKSASLSSIDSVTSLKKATPNDSPHITPSPLHNENRVVSNISLPETLASAPSPELDALSGLPSPSTLSPTKTPGAKSELDRMNELAANARRERKVLDLEISNSSLLAINRSLEKEVRKQKAELRRFRRMSRAGRFSTDTMTASLEGFSAIGLGEIGDLSDMSEEEDMIGEDSLANLDQQEEPMEPGEPGEPEEPDDDSESSFDEGAMSPTTLAERDSAHRLGDEKRLQLDLSKHRELLVDSQKMNQSLKRCLNWTEELIKDAQKALNYQVRPSDVRLGGRVLESEDTIYADHDESRALLSPWTPSHRTTDPLDQISLAGSERTDRDSGIDVDGLKPTNQEIPNDFSPPQSPVDDPQPRTPQAATGMGEAY